MTIRLTDAKKDKLISLIASILNTQKIEIKSVAQVIGQMISSFPAVEYGQLYINVNLKKIKPWLYLKLRVISKLL